MSSDSNNTITSVKKNSKYIASKAHRIKQVSWKLIRNIIPYNIYVFDSDEIL